MSEFVSARGWPEETKPIEKAKLIGDGWYIEIKKLDEYRIEVRCGGGMSVVLIVEPSAANVVYLSTTAEQERQVIEMATRLAEVNKENAAFRKSKGIKD